MIAFGRKLSVDRGPLLVLGGMPLVLLAPIVLTGRVLYWGVPLLQFYPWQKLAAEMWRAGQWPLWNPLVGSGAPLAANLQTGAFYPLNFLHLILPTEYAQTYTAVLHVVLAGLFMYAYLRTLKLSPFAAVIGALAFQLCGFFIARLAFFSVTTAFPWIAAWLWRTEKLVSGDRGSGIRDRGTAHQRVGDKASQRVSDKAIRNALWLALTIGLGVLAGHAQTAVYGLILIGSYSLWRVFTWSTDRQVASSRYRAVALSLVVVATAFGLALAAIQLLPAAELTRESQRAGGLDSTKVLTHSFWPLRLLTLLSPDFFGNPAQNNFWGYDNYWENAAYVGVLPLLLALWVMGQGIRNWGSGIRRLVSESANQRIGESSPVTGYSSLVKFYTLSALVSLVLAFGWFTPIYPFLFQTVPGFALFQGPARWLVVTIPALCALAAFGAQRWLAEGVSRHTAKRLMLLGIAVLIAGVGALLILSGRVATFGPATLRLGVLLIIAGGVFQSRIQHPASQVIVALIVATDLVSAHFALNPVLPPDIYHAPNPTADAIRADGSAGRVYCFDADEEMIKFGRYLATDKKFLGYGPTDLDHWLNARAALIPNAALIDGVSSANNFDSLIVGRYQNLLDHVNRLPFDQALPILSRMNVAYIVSPRSLDLPIVSRTPDVIVYRNAAALPRAWIASSDADLTQSDSMVRGSLIGSLRDSGNAVTIRAASPQDGWLILSDVWYPGWTATVDGVQVSIEMANEAFRAVKFPAGAHQIEFRYEPQSVTVGTAITLVAALVMVVGLATTNRPRINE